MGPTAAVLLAVAALLTPVTLDGHPAGLDGLVGFLLWLVWIGSVSVALLRPSGDRHDVAATPVAAV